MSEIEEIMNGIEQVNDDELDEVAGGAGSGRCDYGQVRKSAFPERCCKNCPNFKAEKFTKAEAAKKYKYECKFFERIEWKDRDSWNFF